MFTTSNTVIEKALSKLASQEKVTSFDPPVRTGETLTTLNAGLVPSGNISHFEPYEEYNGHAWVAKYGVMRRQGYTFANGGFSTKPRKCCGADLVIGMSVYFDGKETPFWVDACAGCGHAWQEIAIPEMVASHV